MNNTLRSILGPALLCGLLVPSSGLAQQTEPRRVGFWLNAGIGWGNADCESCDDGGLGGVAGALALGGTLSQKLLLGASANGWSREDGDVTQTLGALTAMIRFYPVRTHDVYLLGGLGISTREVETDLGGSTLSVNENGTAAILGAGYDIRIGRKLSLTPFGNVIGVDFDGEGTGFTQIGLSITMH